MRRKIFAFIAATAALAAGGGPALAGPVVGLDGSTVQAVSYLETGFPPPAPDCTVVDCNILDYSGPSGPTNSPLPVAPVAYLEDSLTETTVTVSNDTITIVNNAPGLFCPAAGCTAGDFGGYVFTFTNLTSPITGVTDSFTGGFAPVPISPGLPTGLAWTGNTITVNALGDNLANNDTLTLNVSFTTTPIPEPSTWAMMLVGFAGLGFAAYRRGAVAARTA